MKRIVLIVISLVVCFCLCSTVQAKSKIDISTQDIQIKNNRLFGIEICTDCNKNLAAATFEINYDSSIMEYRSVSADVSGGQVKAVDNNGKVKAIFLQSEGVDKDKNKKLFSVKFKSISKGSCNVEISASDCVDSNAKELNCKFDTACKVTVQGSMSTGKSETDNDFPNDEGKEAKANSDKNATQTGNKGEDKKYLSVIPDKTEGQEVYWFIILLLVMIIVIGGGFVIIKMNNIEKHLKQKNIEDSSQNSPKESKHKDTD